MKYIYTFFALAFIGSGLLNAQVTLNTANMPTVGDYQSYIEVNHAGGGPGASGTSVAWDFSAFAATSDTLRISFQNPSLTPSAGSFSTADVAWFDGNGTYIYYKNSAGNFKVLGDVSSTFTLSQPVPYDDEEIFFTFPFAFGSTSVDSFGGAISTPLGTGLRWGEDSVEVDGSGSLNTGDTTYADVIRIRRHVIWTDSVNSALIGDLINEFDYIYYEWWTADGVAPVMTYVIRDYIFATAPVNDTIVHFAFDEIIISVDPGVDPLVGDLNVYPNPASNLSMVSFDLISAGEVKIELLDMNGKLVAELMDDEMGPGHHEFNMRASEYSRGMYMLRLVHPEGVLTRKVIFQ